MNLNVKNNRGFMFVETIVTLTIMITALLLLYNVFSNLLAKENTFTNYDKKSYIYALYHIKESLLDVGYDFQLNPGTTLGYMVVADVDLDSSVNTNHNTLSGRINSFYSNIDTRLGVNVDDNMKDILQYYKDTYGLNRLLLFSCTSTGVSYLIARDLSTYTTTLSCKDPTEEAVKLVGEFYDEIQNKYFYAHIYYPNTNFS